MTSVAPHQVLDRCRGCGTGPLEILHDFGQTPIADRLINPARPREDLSAPLSLAQCLACGLTQIRETVDPKVLFDAEYPYFSSVSPALSRHFRLSAEALIAKYELGSASFVVEAASNDGYMLRHFCEAGVSVLGIDPSDGPVAVARKRGVETLHGFFDLQTAKEITASGKKADLFLANNVLAHVADIDDFIGGMSEVLSDTGVAVVEFPYLIDLVDHRAFDTIYHQHLLYLSLSSLRPILARHGLNICDVERIPVHGGSVRVTIGRGREHSPAVHELLVLEKSRDVGSTAFFAAFLAEMRTLRRDFLDLLNRYRHTGARIAGYGAAAKATTLMHHMGLQKDDLAFIIDKNERKHGLEMPGIGVPIVSPEALEGSDVEVLVLLAWNFANEIMAENQAFLDRGGVFLVPLPDLVAVRGEPIRAAL